MSEYTLGLDFGGGGGRALLLDLESGEATVAGRPWSFAIAPETGGLGSDVDLDRTWSVLVEATREVIERAGASPDAIVGVAATAMRLGNVVIDAAGAPILAVPNRDARAAGPGILLGIHHGEALQRVMGRWPYPIHAAARLQWLAQNRPGDLERADALLSLSDWIALQLCGERACDPSQAAETLLFELAPRAWSTHWTRELGIDAGLLPQIVESGTLLGTLRDDAARALGLRPGVPVAMGGADSQCAILGAGGRRPGTAAVIGGTTAPVQAIVDHAVIDPEVRTWGSQHLVPGRFIVESNAGPTGEVLEWMARVLHGLAPDPVATLLDAAAGVEIGSLGFLSCLGVEVMNDRQMGLPLGHMTLSHLSTGRAKQPGHAVSRALVEGMACGLRANLAQVEARTGPSEGPLLLAGGLSRSRFFAGVLAGLVGRPVRRTTEPSTSGVGAALCAAVAAKRFSSLDEAAASRDAFAEIVEPVQSESEPYSATFERWTTWRGASAALDAAASPLTMPFALAGQQAGSGD